MEPKQIIKIHRTPRPSSFGPWKQLSPNIPNKNNLNKCWKYLYWKCHLTILSIFITQFFFSRILCLICCHLQLKSVSKLTLCSERWDNNEWWKALSLKFWFHFHVLPWNDDSTIEKIDGYKRCSQVIFFSKYTPAPKETS